MPALHDEPSGATWAATHRFAAARVVFPATVDDVRAIVRSEPRVRALGTRHSFNDLADSAGSLVSLQRMHGAPALDPDTGEVWVPAGMPYGALAGWLDARGFALPNLGSLPHISVAGACAAGTHGSGDANGCLSTSVTGLELVDGRGDVVALSSGDAEFTGTVIGLGALGIVTRIRLAVIPRYLMRQDVYVDLPWSTFLERSAEVMGGGYSVSVFGRWGGDTLAQVWRKRVVDDETEASGGEAFFGAASAGDRVMSPADEDHDNTTVQGGVVGPWAERLPHFRFDTVPSNGDEIQSEYFVERARVRDALTAVRALADEIDPILLVSEFRTIAADGLWMSPHFERSNLAIHFTWRNRPDEVRALLPRIEAALEPFDPRPHWGKWFAMDARSIVPKYRRYDEFLELRERFDPARRFHNGYLERVLHLPAQPRST
ncbi:MAG: hypothetical protein K0S37_15 [Microbacterium sp.]|nr:hypothetical protein [Microbacterium sp.]